MSTIAKSDELAQNYHKLRGAWLEELKKTDTRCSPKSCVAEAITKKKFGERLNELALQSMWQTGEFGREFISKNGDKIKILQIGIWNRGFGPDFLQNVVQINGEIRRGDIEIDRSVLDWVAHGHDQNPNFNDVILHFYFHEGGKKYFTGTSSHKVVTQIKLVLPKSGKIAKTADLKAREISVGKCYEFWQKLSQDDKRRILISAADYRLGQKARRLAIDFKILGDERATFQIVAKILGYRYNTRQMQSVAQLAPPLKNAKKISQKIQAEKFGISGFLNLPDIEAAPSDAQAYCRELWRDWWRLRQDSDRREIKDWIFVGTRPQNHPHRRLAALCKIEENWRQFHLLLESENAIGELEEFLLTLEDEFWSTRYTLYSKKVAKKIALIGKERIAAFVADLLMPSALAKNRRLVKKLAERYAKTKIYSINQKARFAAQLFFDDSKAPELKYLRYQQGLLQIYDDFCLKSPDFCRSCKFPSNSRSLLKINRN